MCLLRKASVWLHVILIYGEHVSPVISVTHTRCSKDPTDIPKKSKDPTTSPVRQRKISKKYISCDARGDNIWRWHLSLNSLDNGHQGHYSRNWQDNIMKSCHLLVWLASAMNSVQLQTPNICRVCADPGQKTSTRNNVKNIAPSSEIIWWVANVWQSSSRARLAIIFFRGKIQSKHMPTARIECSVAYPSYIWWACIPSHISQPYEMREWSSRYTSEK